MTQFPYRMNFGRFPGRDGYKYRAIVTRETIRFEAYLPIYEEQKRIGINSFTTERYEWVPAEHPPERMVRAAKAAQAGITNPRTVRFAVWENQTWSRIGLTDGQELEHTEGGPTDEGYSYENTTWIREGDVIRREYTSTARDCDGPMEYRQDSTCDVTEAESDYHEDIETGEIVMRPNWTKTSSSQRDHYAEAAGY